MRFDLKKAIIGVIAFFFCLNILAWIAVFQVSSPPVLKIVFFDVGQGDSIFIETPRKTQILIDGGPSAKVVEELGKEMPFFDRSLDLVIATHADFDHIAGLVEVLKSYQVDLVATNGAKTSSAEAAEFATEAQNNHCQQIVLKKGQRIIIGKLVIEVLAPLEDFKGKEVKDNNLASLVLRLVYDNNSFLLTGDAPQSVEKKLAAENIDLNSQVLKVGHHGSNSSSADIFLQAVSPEIAVIQVGADNRYGHPTAELLGRIEKYGIKVLRTDQQGNILFLADGQNLVLKD